jgi:AcrR family transcriptional regulator
MTADLTRVRLVTAAERLFAERGVDGPSLREITRVAGQRNTRALQYHFGDRDELLAAVLETHGVEIERCRSSLLDQYDHEGASDPRRLGVALAVPLVEQLGDRNGGVHYLQIVGELAARPVRFEHALKLVTLSPSMQRWSTMVEPLLPSDAVGRPLHRRTAVVRFVLGEIASRARERSRRDHRLFANHLVDLVMAMLTAPVSAETLVSVEPRGGR